MIHPLLNQEFRDENVLAQPRDPVHESPDWPWVKALVLLWDFFENMVDERLIDLSDLGVVCSPCVNGETVFAGEEIFEKGHIWCLGRDIYHALEPDIFI